ncbi:MAG: hypothetical protein VX538_06405, partial [Pseudomonadota bacterium]|nr:hypothetical protein [Pseudomonadota bacterium]
NLFPYFNMANLRAPKSSSIEGQSTSTGSVLMQYICYKNPKKTSKSVNIIDLNFVDFARKWRFYGGLYLCAMPCRRG